jgi:hypothetical protein
MLNYVSIKKELSGIGMSGEDFSKIRKVFKKDFKKTFGKIFGKYNFNKDYYEITGNFTYKDKDFYFKVSDSRFFPSSAILIRLCKEYKDFRVKKNYFIDTDENMVTNMLELLDSLI